jgi:NAD(P)-dependent dehydrogenase (short-subunit alcohol dehydrogenase family)
MEEPGQKKYNSPVRAIFTGISDLFRHNSEELSLDNLPGLEGKKVLITGASSGLGLAAAVEMARMGAEVIMAVRSGIPEKGELVKRKSGSEKVHMIRMDLTNLDELITLPSAILRKFGPIDVLICNAAMVPRGSRKLKEGLDEMFVVNYFSKFLLINRIMDEKLLNDGNGRIPRIIFVASESHRNPDGYDWDGFGKYQPYGMNKVVSLYGYYKLLLLTMVNELSRRLNPDGKTTTSVFALCPGPVNTNIAREAPKLFLPVLKLVFSLFFRSPEKACRPLVYLAASGKMEGIAIDYLFLMNRKPMDPRAVDPENGKRLWDLSEDLWKQHKNL